MGVRGKISTERPEGENSKLLIATLFNQNRKSSMVTTKIHQISGVCLSVNQYELCKICEKRPSERLIRRNYILGTKLLKKPIPASNVNYIGCEPRYLIGAIN